MKRFSIAFGILSFLSLGLFSVTHAATITVPTDQPTIQDAINAASSGDTVFILNGAYAPGQISINATHAKPLTIEGQSEAGVIINSASTGRGFEIQGGNVTLRNFTLNGPGAPGCTTNVCYGIKLEGNIPVGPGQKVSGYVLENITVNNSHRTGIDINGITGATLTNITVNNTVSGNGISATDSQNITFTNITTSGNAWGGMAFYSFGNAYPPADATGMVINGTNSFGEPTKIYYQMPVAGNPIGIDATTDFGYLVTNNTPGSETLGVFAADLATAIATAQAIEAGLGNNPNSAVVITNLTTNAQTPDEDPITPGYQAAAPVFDKLVISARDAGNAFKVAAPDGKFYVKENELVRFQVFVNPADTWAVGNQTLFTVGGVVKTHPAYLDSATPITSRTRPYTVAAGDNGTVAVTGLTFFDKAGLEITGFAIPTISPEIVVDTTAPMITSIDPNGVLTNADPIIFTIEFSEPVTGFDATDITVTNGTKGTFTPVDADTYTLEVTPTPSNNITVSVDVAAGTFEDYAGNMNTATGTANVTSDTQAPSLNSAVFVSDNNNPLWAKNNDTITYTLGFDEMVQLDTLNSASTANNATQTLVQEFDMPAFATSDQIIFEVKNGDNGLISVANADFTIVDQAGNTTTISAGDINALIATTITADTTKPTMPTISIASNNALDTTLAKTNDTITVTFETADNLSTNVVLGGNTHQHILNMPITSSSVSGIGAGQTISRFTDGTEDSEVVVPFQIRIKDEAGNKRTVTGVTDGSQVQFDRTDPVVENVSINAVSQDLTAFLGDVPTYYARMGDTINFQFDLCDYVDSQNNPPTGTFFGQAVTMTDGGLIGGACTTGDGNPSTFRRWTLQQTNVDGAEGTVTFSIDAKDNAGNVFMSVTGTTDGTSVIFDKTNPTLPTTIMDLLGPETAQFKHVRNASYTWTGQMDPNPGVDAVSGLFSADVLFDHPSNGTNESAVVLEPTNTYTPATPVAHLDPYTFHVSTVTDKAGNKSGPETTYTQRYTVGVSGQVLDQSGTPIPGASVQFAAAFGEICEISTDLCLDTTDANGFYGEVLLAPNQDYTVSAFERRHYMDKSLLEFGIMDVTKNITLQNILDPHQKQTGGQTVVVRTNGTFIAADGEPDQTLLFVTAVSGEVTVTPDGSGGFIVTSRSRILSVTSNNPDLEIVNNAPNTFTIKGAGTFTGTQSFDNRPSTLAGPTTSGTTGGSAFSSGSSRLGVSGSISGSGKSGLRQPGMTRDEFRAMMQHGWMTYAESLAHAERMNQGRESKILYYVNALGHKVFQGYLPGKLPVAKVGKRYQNHIAYRGGPIRNLARIDIPEENEIPEGDTLTAFEARFETMKEQYQARETEVAEPLIAAVENTRDEKEELYATVMNARVQRLVYNDSYKFRPEHESNRKPSRLERNGANNFKVRIGGKSVGVGTMMGQ